MIIQRYSTFYFVCVYQLIVLVSCSLTRTHRHTSKGESIVSLQLIYSLITGDEYKQIVQW